MGMLGRYKAQIGWASQKESWLITILWTYVLPLVAVLLSAYGSNLARAATTCGSTIVAYGSQSCEHSPLLGYSLIATAAVGTLAAQGWRQAKSAKRETTRSKHLRRFNHKFKAVIDALSDLVRSNQSEDDASVFIRTIVNSGGNLFVYDDLRLTIYQLDQGDPLEGENPEAGLQLVAFGGRSDRPRSGFRPGTPSGDWAIEAAKGSGTNAIIHIGKDERFDKLAQSSWASFMAFPICYNLSNLGILMIDSQVKTEWTYEDQAVGTNIANIVAIGLNLLNRGATDTKPETEALKQKLAHIRQGQGPKQVP